MKKGGSNGEHHKWTWGSGGSDGGSDGDLALFATWMDPLFQQLVADIEQNQDGLHSNSFAWATFDDGKHKHKHGHSD